MSVMASNVLLVRMGIRSRMMTVCLICLVILLALHVWQVPTSKETTVFSAVSIIVLPVRMMYVFRHLEATTWRIVLCCLVRKTVIYV